jgi:hypothetical protein
MDPATLSMLIAGGGALLKYWNANRTNDKAADRQYAALGQAQGAIQGAADKAMGYQEPYLKNAGQDFNQFRNLVQSGFFQQPYGKSFQSQSFQGPSYAFNPSAGKATFASWQPQGGPASFAPMALPGMPAFTPPQTPGGQPGNMVRTMPKVYESVMEGPYQPGIQDVMRQNLPGTNLGPGGVPNPMEEVINRGKIPVDQSRNFTPNGPMTMKQLVDAGYVNRYGGSGTFIPRTYGMPGGMR